MIFTHHPQPGVEFVFEDWRTYQHQRRLSGSVSEWYYPWDVASGCVWDLSALSVREHAEVER